jgi:hypothetical protein
VDLTDADWQLFDEQLFKLGSKGESSPGAFKVRGLDPPGIHGVL